MEYLSIDLYSRDRGALVGGKSLYIKETKKIVCKPPI